MTEVREVLNDSHKQYIEISNGLRDLTVTNFDKVYELLPDVDVFQENKNTLGRMLLSTLRFVEPGFSYYKTDENNFVDDPSSYKPRLMPGSDLDKFIDRLRETQSIVNDLYGHYSVSLRVIKFLLEREHSLIKKNKSLVDNYESVLQKCSDLENKLQLRSLSEKSLFTKKESYLALTEEEKKQDVVEEEPVRSVIVDDEEEQLTEEKPEEKLVTPFDDLEE